MPLRETAVTAATLHYMQKAVKKSLYAVAKRSQLFSRSKKKFPKIHP